MVVRLDLRIDKNTQRNNTNASLYWRLFICLATVFVSCSLLIFFKSAYYIYAANNRQSELTKAEASYAQRIDVIEKELANVEKKVIEDEKILDFILNGAPALEFLHALSKSIPDNVIVESISLTKNMAKIKGIAAGENDIISLIETLVDSICVKSISLPDVSTILHNEIKFCSFSFEAELNPTQDIILFSEYNDSYQTEHSATATLVNTEGKR